MSQVDRKKTWQNKAKEILPFLYLVAGLFAIRWTIVEPYVVPTGSMEPTLKTGDRLYALKCAYDFRLPFTDITLFKTGEVKRGDVILFRSPKNPSITFVKRAIGLPGDRISFKNDTLYVNGKAMDRKLAPPDIRKVMYDINGESHKSLYLENLTGKLHYVILDNWMPPNRYNVSTYDEETIPEGHYFAVGDNRHNSSDSRAWGLVPAENLKGKAMFIWFSSWEWRLRPERIGTFLQ